MVQGVDVDLFRPDDELKKLAKLAVQLELDKRACRTGTVDEALAAVGQARRTAQQWLDAWKAAQDPWFNFTSGNGFYSTDKYWIEHLDIPLGYIRDYVARVKQGEDIDRPTARIAAERDRITDGISRELLDADARPRSTASSAWRAPCSPMSRTTISTSSIGRWACSGARCASSAASARGRLLEQTPTTCSISTRQEVRDALFDYCNAWAVGVDADRSALLAGGDRATQEDHGGAGDTGAAAGAERAAGGDHRALHHHAVGHHDRKRQPLAERRLPTSRRSDRNGGVARHGRGPARA